MTVFHDLELKEEARQPVGVVAGRRVGGVPGEAFVPYAYHHHLSTRDRRFRCPPPKALYGTGWTHPGVAVDDRHPFAADGHQHRGVPTHEEPHETAAWFLDLTVEKSTPARNSVTVKQTDHDWPISVGVSRCQYGGCNVDNRAALLAVA